MICVYCHHPDTAVTNSRAHRKTPSVWRRRRCRQCRHVFTTYEVAALETTVADTTGNSRPFSRGILIVDIALSFAHKPPAEASVSAYELAQTIEQSLVSSTPKTTLTTREIAIAAHQTIKRFDPVAAVQYAARHGLIGDGRR